MTSEAALRVELCDTARALFDRGHNAPMDGNCSARLAGGGFLVTPTGKHKGRLTPADVVRLDEAGAPLDASQRASTELRLHLALYAARPDARAIVHAHSPHVVALSVVGAPVPMIIPEAAAMLGHVALVPYETPATEGLATTAVESVRGGYALVLARHGSVCLGATLFEAYARAEVLEHTAKIACIARAQGDVTELPLEALAALRA